MLAGARSALTLSVLALLLIVGAVWGWAAFTQPLPEDSTATGCDPVTIAKGETLAPGQVTVTVLNAGDREGLAGRTMELLQAAGFLEGELENAPADSGVTVAQIWTDQPGSATVRLVKSWLPEGTTVEQRDTPQAGTGIVVVVVGDDFQELRAGRAEVTARSDTEICSTPG